MKVKIGKQIFSSFEEYQRAYVKAWDKAHPCLNADLNWLKLDWETRIKNPDLFK